MSLKVEEWPIDRLVPYARNPRKNDAVVAKMMSAIREFGFRIPIVAKSDGSIVDGHLRYKAALEMGLQTVPVALADELTDTQVKAFRLLANRSANWAEWDDDLLKLELEELQAEDFPIDMIGFEPEEISLDEDEKYKLDGTGKGNLSANFLYPPFSVLNARDGKWQERKKKWIDFGLRSEEGRKEDLLFHGGIVKDYIDQGTSIFDPVLCEIMYLWFSHAGGLIIDPFAGGSVRGIVASALGRQYVGIDLRDEQVDANREQADILCRENMPVWHVGDSSNIDKICGNVEADFLFSCPPYADLERYSEDPRDLSNMKYDDFLAAYREIIKKACSLLKENRFAAFVVGEVRGKGGEYYNFVGDTIQAFLDAGLKYYNEMILVTVAGSLPLRAANGFKKSRKIGKTHQNVLVFVKGDEKAATEYCGDVEFLEVVPGAESGDA